MLGAFPQPVASIKPVFEKSQKVSKNRQEIKPEFS